MLVEDLFVEVRDVDLVRRGSVPRRLLDMKVHDVHLGIGDWQLRLPSEHSLVPILREPGSGALFRVRGKMHMSGPMTTWSEETTKENPGGITTFKGVSDTVLLSHKVVLPDPTNPANAQLTGYDIRTGKAESVMKDFVKYNLGSLALPARRGLLDLFTLTATDLARGPNVTKSARFTNLLELLGEIALYANMGFRIIQVGNHLEFDVYEIRDRTSFVRFDVNNNTLASETLIQTAPGLTQVYVLGQGDLQDRKVVTVTNTEAQADSEAFGFFIESVKDQRQTNDDVELAQAGAEDLESNGRILTDLNAVPSDDQTMVLGDDWDKGDLVTVQVLGQELPTTVTETAIVANSSGVAVAAAIGDPQPTTVEQRSAASVATRVGNLERNTEAGTSLVPVGGTDLNNLIVAKKYLVADVSLANTLSNWPVPAIPTAATADANNAAGSFRDAPPGELEVVEVGGRVHQVATVFSTPGTSAAVNLMPSAGSTTVYRRRLMTASPRVWGPWLCDRTLWGIRNETERQSLSLKQGINAVNPRSPMTALFSWGPPGDARAAYTAPYQLVTIDGVQWWREANGTRVTVTGWQPLTWEAASGVTNYEAANVVWPWPSAIRTALGIIVVRGLGTKATAIANGTVITKLPPGMRPGVSMLFGGANSNNTSVAQIRVDPNGDVVVVGGHIAGFIDVSSIMFPAADVAPASAWTAITLSANWSSVGGVYGPACYWQDPAGRVWFRGVVARSASPGAADNTMFTLPVALAPALFTHQGVASGNGGFASIHYTTISGALSFIFKAGNNTYNPSAWGSVSLSQINLFPDADIPGGLWASIGYANGWSYYGAPYAAPGRWDAPDGITHFRGLFTGTAGAGTPNSSFEAAYANYKGAKNVMGFAVSSDRFARTSHDYTGGSVITSWLGAWISVDGLHYMTEG